MKFSSLVVGIALFGVATPAHAEQKRGGAGSHGGDMLVSEFTGSARLIAAEILKRNDPSSCPASAELLRAIDDTEVSSSLTVVADGVERDATNDREAKTILISRSRLINTQDPLNYLTVVLHEYLGILGFEKTNEFKRSQGCIQQLQVLGVDLPGLRYRVNPLSGLIEKFVRGELSLNCPLGNTVTKKYVGSIQIGMRRPLEVPTKKERRSYLYAGQVSKTLANGNRSYLSSFGADLVTTAERLGQWRVRYDVGSGTTTIRWRVALSEMIFATESDRDGVGSAFPDAGYLSGLHFELASDSEMRVTLIPNLEKLAPYLAGTCTAIYDRPYGTN